MQRTHVTKHWLPPALACIPSEVTGGIGNVFSTTDLWLEEASNCSSILWYHDLVIALLKVWHWLFGCTGIFFTIAIHVLPVLEVTWNISPPHCIESVHPKHWYILQWLPTLSLFKQHLVFVANNHYQLSVCSVDIPTNTGKEEFFVFFCSLYLLKNA